MLPEAYLAHSTPGRLRVKIPSKKGDRAYFDSLAEKFSMVPGVRKIEVNPLTASVLVFHDFDLNTIDVKAIAEYTEWSGLFKVAPPGSSTCSASDNIARSFREVDRKIKAFTEGAIDIPTLTSLGLVGAGLFQIGKGNLAAPAWHVAFWYALNIFLQSQSRKNNNKNVQGEIQRGGGE